MRYDDARPQFINAADAVGLVRQCRAQDETLRADADDIAQLEVQPVEQGRRDNGAPHPVALGQRCREILGRIERHRAVERISAIDGFHFDQAARCAVVADRHRAHSRQNRHGSLFGEELLFVVAGGALRQVKFDIAAQQGARIGVEPGIDRGGERTDTGDHRNA